MAADSDQPLDGDAATDADADIIAAAEAFVRHLECEGVFAEIKAVEARLKDLAGELEGFGRQASERSRETDNLAAHVLALEALVATLMRQVPVPDSEIEDEVRRRTQALTGDADGSDLVQAIAREIRDRSEY